MSLYGNIKKIGSASFQFDRKYSNRVEMDSHASTDGVYAGRYVLVEYGYRFGVENADITHTDDGTAISSQFPDSYKLINTADGSVRVEGVTENETFKNNAETDLRTYGAVYDSTVWQKIYVAGVDKYIMVAELNAMAPKLDITQDKPIHYQLNTKNPSNVITGKFNERGSLIETVRLTNTEESYNTPYFDTGIDTELTYLMHLPTTLNLEIDNDTINFNEKGFNVAYSYPEDEGVSTIAWIPKGLDDYTVLEGQHDAGGNPLAELNTPKDIDTKMLFMSFPALGNAMNALYNLLYGKPDPEDDLEHGAMRPYFKRFLDGLTMRNKIIVYDNDGNSYYVMLTKNGQTNFIYAEGEVDGRRITPIFNRSDVEGEISPSFIIARWHDEVNNTYVDLENTNEQAPYVLYNTLTGEYISVVMHVPNGDEDPDLSWLTENVPALADILANNTAGLATVLSSLFGDLDPLTGTTRYYLYSDWSTKVDDNSSGPAIVNKPRVVGGYHMTFVPVLGNAEKTNLAGEVIYETPGYFYNINPETGNTIETIAYPHTELKTDTEFSGGHYSIDFNTWQLMDYTEETLING